MDAKLSVVSVIGCDGGLPLHNPRERSEACSTFFFSLFFFGNFYLLLPLTPGFLFAGDRHDRWQYTTPGTFYFRIATWPHSYAYVG